MFHLQQQQDEVCPGPTDGGGTVAYASSCAQDQFGRPVVTFINFCPHMVDETDLPVRMTNRILAESITPWRLHASQVTPIPSIKSIHSDITWYQTTDKRCENTTGHARHRCTRDIPRDGFLFLAVHRFQRRSRKRPCPLFLAQNLHRERYVMFAKNL